MPKIIVMMLCVVCFISCRKTRDFSREGKSFLEQIKMELDDSLSEQMNGKVDYNGGILTRLNNDSMLLLRFPCVGEAIENKFIVLRIEEYGRILEGRIIEIEQITNGKSNKFSRENNDNSKANLSETMFNGKIIIQHLDGREILQSTITNGYIDDWHNDKDLLSSKVQEDIDVTPIKPTVYKLLPEVIITATSGGSWGGYTSSNWYNMGSFFYGSSGAGSSSSYFGSNISAYYSSAKGGAQTSAGGGESKNTTKDNYVREDKSILVDFELMPDNVIDVNSYLKCFELIPDNGANCSIELFTDIPVDGKPNVGFDVQTGSPGHTFLQIVKTGNGQRITQNVGFYPSSQFKTLLTTAPIDGVFSDNQDHEFNASIKMSITLEQLKSVIDQISRVARHPKYDIDDYNCTDFALSVFNSVRGTNILEIPRLDIPETMSPYGSNTPQGLYLKLEEMKTNGSPEANEITIPGVKGYVGKSHGACN